MELIQTFNKSIGGFWDGGAKKSFCWKIDGESEEDSKGKFIRVGSMDANRWFYVALGETEKLTLSNAARKLHNQLKKSLAPGMQCTFEYFDENGGVF